VVVDVAAGRLEDKDVLVADGLCDLDVDLPIGELRDSTRSKLNAKPRWIVKSQSVDWFRAAQANCSSPLGHSRGELRMAVAFQQAVRPE
jgi:hypothetical protein